MDPTTQAFSFDIPTLIRDGGMIMYPLVVCSILATIVLVERAIALLGARRAARGLSERVLHHVRGGNLPAAYVACGRSRSPLAQVLTAGLQRAASPQLARQAMERARAALSLELKRGLWILGTIGAAAPFVGLFGTVVGIIRAFHNIGATGKGGFPQVASGISEALIATGAGIAVAVIAFAAHNYFQVFVASLGIECKVHSDEVLEAIEHDHPRAVASLGAGVGVGAAA
jgi:biopolymer transport protein ExbB